MTLDLSRPREGQRNVITMKGIRFAKVISKKFYCPRCRVFCGELIPILDRAVRDYMRRHNRNLMEAPELQAKVYCYAGCHLQPGWGWENFNWKNDVPIIRAWPTEWSDDEIRRKEAAAREANKRFKEGER